MPDIRFDDVKGLEAFVSDEYGEWGEAVEISQQKIDAFAELTGDRQWIHVDVERAKRESPFGGPVAHGFLTLSLLPALNATTPLPYRLTGVTNAVNYGSDKLRFLAPVPAGASVHSRMRLVSVQATDKGTRIENEVAIHVVGNDRPALVYSMIVLYQGKPA